MASRSFELSIGGLCFSANLPDGLRLVEDDPDYLDFLDHAAALPGEARLPVTLTLDEPPEIAGLPAVFDAGTWSAHRAGAETILRLRSPGDEDSFLWLARIEPTRVTVHCGSRLVDRRRDETVLQNPLHYPLDQLLAMFALAPLQGLICHAAGIVHDGAGILLAGRSGAGKTTFMRLTAGRPEIEGLSDDRLVVRRVDGRTLVYGTPWAGEGRVAVNRAVPLKALVFLHQATRNELRPIAASAALAQLLPVASILWFDRERMEQTTALCGELVETLPSYELHFRPEGSAVDSLIGL